MSTKPLDDERLAQFEKDCETGAPGVPVAQLLAAGRKTIARLRKVEQELKETSAKLELAEYRNFEERHTLGALAADRLARSTSEDRVVGQMLKDVLAMRLRDLPEKCGSCQGNLSWSPQNGMSTMYCPKCDGEDDGTGNCTT